MQYLEIKSKTKEISIFFFALLMLALHTSAQVNAVEFGKNRVQYRNFKWQYYQTQNFNTYFYDHGQPLAKYVAQIAEEELPKMEQFVEYGLQRRANIVVYNDFDELRQSNIGLSIDWQTTGGTTKLVNNKMIVYFDGDHYHLRRMIKEGIARTLVENLLFGDDLGEFATNHALLDLPQWLVDGYVKYAAENWSTDLDDQLKSVILSGDYKNFYQFAFDKPLLAGHAFWHYIETKYKKENVTYFLYLARVYRNLNGAAQRICKKKFKEVLKDFMLENEDLYYKDIRRRRNAPKGTISIVEETSEGKDFFNFTPVPSRRNYTYAVVEYKKGKYYVVLYENMVDRKVLLTTGVRSNENEVNPNYPQLAWDPKGQRLACIYWEEGKIKLFVYDMVARYKPVKEQVLDQFDQIQDMKYMLDNNTLLLSAIRNGQSDIYVYKIDKGTFEQITNDVYADLDATFVAFPSKTGIIYSSNRPNANVIGNDSTVPSDRYNIFLVDNWNKSEFKQITQLTNMKYGDARDPMQYNNTHFTFVSNESGVSNRYAGFFSTARAGIDSLYMVGDEILRNPDDHELDSTLKAWGKDAPDSVFTFSVTNDSAYVFPITNYQSGLIETKIAGDEGMVSEVRQEGNLKMLYKLKVDERALRRRNVNPAPTEYRKQTMEAAQKASGEAIHYNGEKQPPPVKDSTKPKDMFDSQFDDDNDKKDSTNLLKLFEEPSPSGKESVLRKARLFDYKLKFSADNFSGGFNNDVLVNRYEPYTGALPINLQGGGAFNGLLKASVFDLFEDIRFTGAIRLPLIGSGGSAVSVGSGGVSAFVPVNQSLFDGGGEWYARADYLKKRFDYSLIYYRKTEVGDVNGLPTSSAVYNGKMYTNLYQAVVKYPLDRVRSIRLSAGIRTDKIVVRGDYPFDPISLKQGDLNKQVFAVSRLEYVHDNTITKATNILNGLRFKIYTDLNSQVNQPDSNVTKDLKPWQASFNAGFDARYYYPIYRNFIWAGRAAGDFSWGSQKIIYYAGGVDGWMFPKANERPTPQDDSYAYQSLAVNLRGFNQNVSNGNNALILNSEFRFPVFATLFNKPINNAFLRNFQLIQFIDLGSAWNGAYGKIERPYIEYPSRDGVVTIRSKAGGIGPFAGGYGFGARSTLLGYFMRLDAGWQMDGFFSGKPILYLSMGVDF